MVEFVFYAQAKLVHLIEEVTPTPTHTSSCRHFLNAEGIRASGTQHAIEHGNANSGFYLLRFKATGA
jgi:hypothetical protein